MEYNCIAIFRHNDGYMEINRIDKENRVPTNDQSLQIYLENNTVCTTIILTTPLIKDLLEVLQNHLSGKKTSIKVSPEK